MWLVLLSLFLIAAYPGGLLDQLLGPLWPIAAIVSLGLTLLLLRWLPTAPPTDNRSV
jgi:hypothetical protein